MAADRLQTRSMDKTLRSQVLKHIASFSFASLIGGIGAFFNSYFAALLLGPMIWGIWKGASLILLYGANLHLGVQNAMQREIPILRGKKDLSQQSEIINVTFTFNLIAALTTSIIILAFSLVINLGAEFSMCLRFISFVLFFQYIASYFGALFRANNEFGIVSWITIIDGLGYIFSIALIFFYGLPGFLGGQLIRTIITSCYCYLKSSYATHWYWDSEILKSLIKIGFPIMMLLFANILFSTIDRLLILNFLDARNLGYYSLGNLFFAPLMLLFNASNSVMYPRFAEKYGESGDTKDLKQYITVPVENLATVTAILIGTVYITLPLLTAVFLPEYSEGITAARIILFGLFFFALTGMAGVMLITINRQLIRLLILLGSVAFNLVFSYTWLKLGYGIQGVAVGASSAYFIFFLSSIIISLRYSKTSYKEIFGWLLAKILGPFFYIGSILVVLTILIPIPREPLAFMIERTVLLNLAFLILNSFFIYRTLKSGLITAIFRRSERGSKHA